MKPKIQILLLPIAILILFGGLKVYAQLPPYVPLAPIQQTVSNPGCDPTITDPNAANACKTDFASYVKGAFNLAIIIAAVLAIIMITWGGIKYMTTEAVTSKGDAKKTINNALIGLLMALGAYIILLTINSKLVDFNLTNIEPATATGNSQTPVTPNNTSVFCDFTATYENGTTWTASPIYPLSGSSCLDICNLERTKYVDSIKTTRPGTTVSNCAEHPKT